MAPLPGLAQPPNPPVARPVNYSQFYAGQVQERPALTRIMSAFSDTSQYSSDQLTDIMFTNTTLAQAYLSLFNTVAGPRIFCFHRPSKLLPDLTQLPSAHDNHNFAFIGDVVEGMITTIQLPENVFALLPEFDAQTAASCLQHLRTNPNATSVPPPTAAQLTADASLTFRTRCCIPLPTQYANLLLDTAGYPPRTAFLSIYSMLEQDNALQECLPLVNWLRLVVSAACPEPDALLLPPCDPTLTRHRVKLLRSDLPPPLPAPTPQADNALLLQACTALVRNAELLHTRSADPTPTPPTKRWAGVFDTLLWACRVEDEEDLPPVWTALANAPKLNGHSVLQNSFITFSASPDTFHPLHPVITDSVYKDIMALRFCGESHDDITIGISPFAVTEGSTAHRRENMAITKMQLALADGASAASLRDIEQLHSKIKLTVPHNYMDFLTAIGVFGNFIAHLFGNHHDLVISYRRFHSTATTTLAPLLQDAFASLRVHPAQILRRLQLECYRYFNSLRLQQDPVTPNFSLVTDELHMGVFNAPFLPAVLERLLHSPPLGSLLPALSAISDSSTSNSSAGGWSTTSSLSSPSVGWTDPLATLMNPSGRHPSPSRNRPQPNASLAALLEAAATLAVSKDRTGDRSTGDRTGGPRRVKVDNTARDAAFAACIPANTRVAAFLGTAQPPKTDNNTDMCLKFHLTGSCWSTCPRAADHKAQSAGEHARLLAFVQARAQALARPARASPGVPP